MTAADIATGWIELHSLLNNTQRWTFEALTHIKSTVILPVFEFHSDNGSEFINNATEAWCKKERIPFTRSRCQRKNDNCFVEQKNGAVVREYIGYYRFQGQVTEQARITAIYRHLVPLLNYFMPTQKLKSKTRIGSKEIKVYDEPRSPFQRLVESAELSQHIKDLLSAQISLYNPVALQHNGGLDIFTVGNRRRRCRRLTQIQPAPQ